MSNSTPTTLWKLYFEKEEGRRIIYSGNFKGSPTCPKSVIRFYWPEISDSEIANLATNPILDEANNRRLEWEKE